jgi:Galactose oxidase, central domain
LCVGGQLGENEQKGNTKNNYEWIAANDTWVARQSMALSRGHAASSTKAIGCGFLVIGGTTNEQGMTGDISFYDIPSNSWTSIGSLPAVVNTAVCETGGGYLYCETGWADGHFSLRRKIVLSYK